MQTILKVLILCSKFISVDKDANDVGKFDVISLNVR